MSGVDDLYPVAEKRPDLVATPTGKPLDAITLDAVLAGDLVADDIRITPEALRLQAEIARKVARDRLAENLERGAELAHVPQDEIMATYELLRPGRAKGPEELRAAAERFRSVHGAPRVAALIDEAADVYVRRGLFTRRF
jgi:propanediol dehydratase small subunit